VLSGVDRGADSCDQDARADRRMRRSSPTITPGEPQIARLNRPVALPGFFNCTACVTVIDARPEDPSALSLGRTTPSRSWDSSPGTDRHPFILLMANDALDFNIPRIWIIATGNDEQRDTVIAELTDEFRRDAPSALILPQNMKDLGAEVVDIIESDRIVVLGSGSAAKGNRFYAITDPAGIKLMRAALMRLIDAQDAADNGWDDALGVN